MWFVPWPILNLAHSIPQKISKNIAVVNLFCLSDASVLPNPFQALPFRIKIPWIQSADVSARLVLSGSLWMSHSLAISQEEVQHRCQHHVWRSSPTELSQSAPGICSSAQPDPKCEISHDMSAWYVHIYVILSHLAAQVSQDIPEANTFCKNQATCVLAHSLCPTMDSHCRHCTYCTWPQSRTSSLQHKDLPESRAHFSKIQGNRSNRYPDILYLSLLMLHHDASFWLIRWV